MTGLSVKLAGPGDRAAWNAIVGGALKPHVLQSWEWGTFKADHGWAASRLVFRRNGDIVGAASLLYRRAGHFSAAYVPEGAVMDYQNGELAAFVLAEVIARARRQRAIYV